MQIRVYFHVDGEERTALVFPRFRIGWLLCTQCFSNCKLLLAELTIVSGSVPDEQNSQKFRIRCEYSSVSQVKDFVNINIK